MDLSLSTNSVQKISVKDWNPQPAQAKVLSRSEREIFTGGSRFGGKTELGLAWLAEPEYYTHPMYRGLVIRKDYDDLKQWLLRARLFYQGIANISGTPARITWQGGGVTDVGHWKDKETISKYIGQEYHKILIEEMTQTIRSEEEYNMILGSLRSSVPELRTQLMANANPGGPGHSFAKAYFVDKCMVSECCQVPIIRRQTDGQFICTVCEKETRRKLRVYVSPSTGSSRVFIPLGFEDNQIGCSNDPQYVAWLKGLGGALGMAWRDGDWNAFKGQFFSNFGPHLKEIPFRLEVKDNERLFGSLDYGCGANGVSSFGFWYVDDKNIPHRVFTKTSRGLISASEQAGVLEDYIASFDLTGGRFPKTIFYDNSMDSRAGLKGEEWATIDYFKAVMDKHGVKMVPANKSRVNGWQVMIDYFGVDQSTHLPKMRYFEGYNDDFVSTIPDLVSDPNRPDDVEKCDIDHWADECRYGLVGIRSSILGLIEGKGRGKKVLIKCANLMRSLEYSGRITDTGLN